ncbi:class I SAM-dependent methyltransferase [Magnetospirillum sp. UT-4]|uniref:class I SAM-dependent methyltransferase n=1 Tax=Magnetospirillum sp. UT-4 TaxID=2681467 RepID=UPI00137D8A1D|nr:class I SAM-dependent methyltransferase [Magnetospirillum sp. UT-4]CAA7625522.1 C-methyltransferase [Magnetospirillum sp. UT-4]
MKDADPREDLVAQARTGCRFCGGPLHDVVDLGMSPLCESFLAEEQLDRMEPFYPLKVRVCGDCFLMQLGQYVAPADIFGEYAYFSSYSDTYLEHARSYVEAMIARLGLNGASRVVELASNDGYLLRHFVARGIPALGIEPAANVARAALAQGVPTRVAFFGAELGGQLEPADLVIANNVLAQVPDLNDFVAGMRRLLKPHGVATVEFPHLLTLIAGNQYDTIYHEHFSYFSLGTARRIFAAHGLAVFDVEAIWTHGGSLRLYLAADGRPVQPCVAETVAKEAEAGLDRLAGFAHFAEQVRQARWNLLDFLIRAKWYGKSIAAYGAPGKGNTLLNYCGIRGDILDYAVDRNPYKHGKYTPGTHIPIHPPERLSQTRPDYVLVLPWNLRHEIMDAHAYIRDWGGRFVVPIPDVAVFP